MPDTIYVVAQGEPSPIYLDPKTGQLTPIPIPGVEPWGVEYTQTTNDGRKSTYRRQSGAPSDGSADAEISYKLDPEVRQIWDQQHRVAASENDPPKEKDENGRRYVWRSNPPDVNDGRGGYYEDVGPAGPNAAERAAAEETRRVKNDELSAANKEKELAQELIRIQTAQRLAGVQEAQLAQSIDDAKKPQKLPDGTFVAWDKNENGEWIARKVNNATSGPKGMAESHDSALAGMRLGTVAKASQNYMTELLRRTSLPPNDPEFMTSEQASAAMTSFISEGDIFLREQQGLLGEQSKVQATQLTQRNQDLMEVQSRRNFQQTNVQQAAQHDTDVNKYLSAKDAHLAGPGFLGQIMLTNNLAGQYGGMDAVPQIQQTPMQSGLMGLPSFAVQDLGPGTIPGPPRAAPVPVNPQQPMPGIIAPQ